MIKKASKSESRTRRHERLRKKLAGTAEKPRLAVFRSQKHVYAQLIDDSKAHTLVSASSLDELKLPEAGKPEKAKPAAEAPEAKKEAKASKEDKAEKGKKAAPKSAEKPAEKQAATSEKPTLTAKAVGALVAKRALEKGISQVVFDRGGVQYHGRVKALADAAREAGLKF